MRYCVCFLLSEDLKEVLLVYKKKGQFPFSWNGIGGKFEPGERKRAAASREIKEEVSIDIGNRLVHLETIYFTNEASIGKSDTVLDVFCARINKSEVTVHSTDIGEEIDWWLVDKVSDLYLSLSGDGRTPYFVHASCEVLKRQLMSEM